MVELVGRKSFRRGCLDGDDYGLAMDSFAKKVSTDSSENLFSQIDSFGRGLEAKVLESAGTIYNGEHWVNIVGIHAQSRLSWFGGKMMTTQLLAIRNPIGGVVSWINKDVLNNVRVFKY